MPEKKEKLRVPAPGLPLDARHMVTPGFPHASSRTTRLSENEFEGLRNLCVMVAVAQLFIAAAWFGVGWMTLDYLLPVIFSTFIIVLAASLSSRLLIPRSRLMLWFALFMLLCVGQAILWADFWLLETQPTELLPQLGAVLAMALLLAPLAYRPISLLLALSLVLGAVWLSGADGERFGHLGLVLVALFSLALGFFYLSRLNRHSDAIYEEMRVRLVQGQADLDDHHQRLEYEREQREQLERDLVQVREVAASAAHAKTEFLATISHEIRTPLNGILPILEILQQSKLDEEQQRYVSTAFSSSHHLLRIIDDILDFARAESGKLTLEAIEFDLQEMIYGVVDLMRSSAQNKGLNLSVEIEPEVPSVLRGDPMRIRQVLTNLLSNAVKFTDHGDVRIEVKQRRASRKEVELLFEVSDTGMGMSRETASKLFDSFTQADASTTRKHGGAGLGLVICKRLVELMGGKISLRTRLGEGSVFWFVLPMRRSTRDVPSARENLEGVRMMWFINDKQTAQLAGRLFDEWGMLAEPTKLENVISSLHTAAMLGKSWAYQLLLVDSWSVELRLAKVLAELREDPLLRELPVVVASGSDEVAERLHRDFGVYTLTGGIRPAPLQRCLYRLFDVDPISEESGDIESQSAFRDLNLEKELALQEFSPDIPSDGDKEHVGRVLLVEDNPVNLGVVRRVLDRLGVGTLVAQNGREALEQLQSQSFDVVFMDCQMPVMDGYEATRQWREVEMEDAREHVPVVAMTANAMQGDREKCLDAGMDDYLAKPVSIASLQQMLEKWAPRCFEKPLQKLEGYAPEKADRKAVLDEQVLEELREVMGGEFTELVQTYLANVPELMRQIVEAVKNDNMPALVLPSHSLKSSSANMGAMRLSQLARELEMAARNSDRKAVLRLRPAIAPVFQQTQQQLQAELNQA